MKKKFKTIMAMAAALAISFSAICMASAGSKELAYNPESQGFGEVTAPMTFTYDNTVSGTVTVEWGAMNFIYSPYTGWGDSFANGNNEITVTNNATVPIRVNYNMYIDNSNYPDLDHYDPYNPNTNIGFRLTSDNQNGLIADENIIYEQIIDVSSSDGVYVTISNENPTISGNYNETEIGSITIEVYPNTD